MANQENPARTARRFRMDQGEWDDYEHAAQLMETDRSVVTRDLIRWWMRKPGAKLPPRPPKGG